MAFIESNREINTGESIVLFMVWTLNTNYGLKKTLFMIPSIKEVSATAYACPAKASTNS